MKYHLGLALVLANILSGAAFAQVAGDAVSVDPDVHHVILDNQYVRVFDARAAVGTKSPMHSHPPTVLVSVGKSRLRVATPDGKSSIFDLNSGNVLWLEGVRHSWELLVGELHAIGVEIKSAQKEGTPPARTAEQMKGDAVTVDPDTHRVILENPHVRVYEGRVSHGNSSPMHAHPPLVAVSLDWARLKQTFPDGTSSLLEFSPGQVIWLPEGVKHSWHALAGNARVIVIEVKAAQAEIKQ